MHSEARVLNDRWGYPSHAGNSVNHDVGRRLAAFVAHLNNSGKICLKPWCWKRFYLLFNPGFEPPWLSSWWTMPNHDKKDIFLKQLEYLAYQTDQFDAADQFLRGLTEDNWVSGNRGG
jgi:hypothetical protein